MADQQVALHSAQQVLDLLAAGANFSFPPGQPPQYRLPDQEVPPVSAEHVFGQGGSGALCPRDPGFSGAPPPTQGGPTLTQASCYQAPDGHPGPAGPQFQPPWSAPQFQQMGTQEMHRGQQAATMPQRVVPPVLQAQPGSSTPRAEQVAVPWALPQWPQQQWGGQWDPWALQGNSPQQWPPQQAPPPVQGPLWAQPGPPPTVQGGIVSLADGSTTATRPLGVSSDFPPVPEIAVSACQNACKNTTFGPL